jgi:hypothetical protein
MNKEVCQWDRQTLINELRAFVELCQSKAENERQHRHQP